MATDEGKVYPGNLARYRELRAAREALEATESPDPALVQGANLVEQLAGLAFILDGIRFSARQRS